MKWNKPIYFNDNDKWQNYENTMLLLAWPVPNSDVAYESLKNFKGDYILYIGDEEFTTNNAFYNLLEKKWKKIKELQILRWVSLREHATIYSRNINY